MKKHLLAALILLPLTLSAAPASAAGEAADQARLINLFDMAELSGILHKEAMECGISRQDDPFYAPGGKLHTALLKGIKQTAAKLAYAQGKGKKERLFAETGGCSDAAKAKIKETQQWLLDSVQALQTR